jgi:hypothetical protein
MGMDLYNTSPAAHVVHSLVLTVIVIICILRTTVGILYRQLNKCIRGVCQ